VPSLINIAFELDILTFDQKTVIILLQKSKNMFFAVINIVNFTAVAPEKNNKKLILRLDTSVLFLYNIIKIQYT